MIFGASTGELIQQPRKPGDRHERLPTPKGVHLPQLTSKQPGAKFMASLRHHQRVTQRQ